MLMTLQFDFVMESEKKSSQKLFSRPKKKYKNKIKAKLLPLETKHKQKKEYWRLGLLSLFTYCCEVYEAVYPTRLKGFDFQIKQSPKEITIYNLHYGDVLGDVLRPAC